jgi:hypothetical protein
MAPHLTAATAVSRSLSNHARLIGEDKVETVFEDFSFAEPKNHALVLIYFDARLKLTGQSEIGMFIVLMKKEVHL